MTYIIVSDIAIWALGDTPEAAWRAFDDYMGDEATHEGFELRSATPALMALVSQKGGAGISWAYRADGTACTEGEAEPVKPLPPLVVTRHAALIDYLVEIKLIPAGTPYLTHATPEQLQGRHVIGVLPLHLAACCASVTEIPLDLPAEARGRELTLYEMRQYAGDPVTYSVKVVS